MSCCSWCRNIFQIIDIHHISHRLFAPSHSFSSSCIKLTSGKITWEILQTNRPLLSSSKVETESNSIYKSTCRCWIKSDPRLQHWKNSPTDIFERQVDLCGSNDITKLYWKLRTHIKLIPTKCTLVPFLSVHVSYREGEWKKVTGIRWTRSNERTTHGNHLTDVRICWRIYTR